MAGFPNPTIIAQEAESTLAELERRLLCLLQDGRGAQQLEDIICGLAQIVLDIGKEFMRVQDILDRRDLTFDAVTQLEVSRKRSLWLYRKSKLEYIFFAKLHLERSLRDTIYNYVIETFQEMSCLEEAEREFQVCTEESLALQLLKEPIDATNG